MLLLFACVVLSACDGKPTPQESSQQHAAHVASAASAASLPLTPRVLRAGANELLVLDVPSVTFETMISRQRCYVWRDAEFKTATISCPGGEAPLDLGDEGAAGTARSER